MELSHKYAINKCLESIAFLEVSSPLGGPMFPDDPYFHEGYAAKIKFVPSQVPITLKKLLELSADHVQLLIVLLVSNSLIINFSYILN